MRSFLRRSLFLAVLGLTVQSAQAQVGVGIGTITPDPSAALDISSARQGLLVPRVALTGPSDATTISAPATGLTVYNTALTAVPLGLVSNQGTPTAPNWLPTGGLSWALRGNASTDPTTNFLGTTDNQPLALRLNNQQVARFETNGTLSLGLTSGIGIGTGTGYSGSRSTAVGYLAGSVNTAADNSFLGAYAGNRNSTGTKNVFLGANSGIQNTTGVNNVYIGYNAGSQATTTSNNHFVGYSAGAGTTTGAENMFEGYRAGVNTTTGNDNMAIGFQAGRGNMDGNGNLAIGYEAALYNGAYGGATNYNLAIGYQASASSLGGGDNNIAIGYQAGYIRDGSNDIAIGYQAGYGDKGSNNTYLGYQAGFGPEGTGFNSRQNTFLGYQAGYNILRGANNLYVGYNAGYPNTSGNNNLAIGYLAGVNATTSTNSTFLGYQAGLASTTQHTNASAIGYMALVDRDNALVLGGTGTYAVNVGIGTTTPGEVLTVQGNILASGTITQNSDRRLKTNVRALSGALASMDKLRGVRYEFLPGKGPAGEQVGVIAQEVEAVYPELVRTDSATGIKSVNYTQLTPVLLEAIKELHAQLAAQTALLDASATHQQTLEAQQDRTTASLQELREQLRQLQAGQPALVRH